MSQFRPIVISGPSGVGKTSLLNKLFSDFSDVLAFSVSHTTRKPRIGEVNGKEYHFVEKEEFERMIKNNEFLEHAQFSNNFYGTSKKSVDEIAKSGRICVLDVEINGVKSIRAANLGAIFIFVNAPTLASLKERLAIRGTEAPDKLQERMDTAQEAINYANLQGSYDHIIVNDSIDTCYQKLLDILRPDMMKARDYLTKTSHNGNGNGVK